MQQENIPIEIVNKMINQLLNQKWILQWCCGVKNRFCCGVKNSKSWIKMLELIFPLSACRALQGSAVELKTLLLLLLGCCLSCRERKLFEINVGGGRVDALC